MNIAVFGGSFDPPHIGHEQIVYQVLNELYLDKLLIVPTFLNPFKIKFHFKPNTRFDLLQELFKGNHKIEVSNFEILNDKPTPSIITIKHFKQIYNPKKIYLIIGSDNLEKLHLWSNFKELNELVEFVVITRDGYEAKNDIIRFKNIKLDIPVSSTSLRESLNLDLIPTKIQQKVKKLCNNE
ncbi:MAG: nicotinate (nicotinamide) nucleotide adenylyltransferase [Campylobacterota bacterium]|nr:nicotinate (nicotinamide) nucleotide adenylyltransferase [Campylobacterota bacterium]